MLNIILDLVNVVEKFGYLGIFIMTIAEGTFIPIPNEVTLIPAGFLVTKGKLALIPVLIFSILGNFIGSMISYSIARMLGRKFIMNYGKYVGLHSERLKKMEDFFHKYGKVSVFLGRIVPGVKHFISFPAGLAKMDGRLFSIYSSAGGGLWVTTLILIGMLIGNNESAIELFISRMNWSIWLVSIVIILIYIVYSRRNKAKS